MDTFIEGNKMRQHEVWKEEDVEGRDKYAYRWIDR